MTLRHSPWLDVLFLRLAPSTSILPLFAMSTCTLVRRFFSLLNTTVTFQEFSHPRPLFIVASLMLYNIYNYTASRLANFSRRVTLPFPLPWPVPLTGPVSQRKIPSNIWGTLVISSDLAMSCTSLPSIQPIDTVPTAS